MRDYALGQFRQPAAIKAVLGQQSSVRRQRGQKAIISKFLLRAYRGNAARMSDYERVFHGLYATRGDV